MDAKNFEYLKKKVVKYEQLNDMKKDLERAQKHLCNDENLMIVVDCQEINEASYEARYKQLEDECGEFFREIKDNLIDTIGMKIVEINEKMEEL